MAKISVVRGSVLDQPVEAIVNAANTAMRGGGGVDGAIHRAAGPELVLELMRVAPHGAKTGQVVTTSGLGTGFKYIFHTPGPVWNGGENREAELLAACYRNSMLEAERLAVRSIAFPSISTGIFRFPLEIAASLAIRTVADTATQVQEIVFAMFGEEEYQTFAQALAKWQRANPDQG